MTDRNFATLPVGGSGAGMGAGIASTIATHRVLRNTYALLSLTLMWAAAVASAGVLFNWAHPGMLISLVGTLGLFFLVYKLRNSAAALPAVFALTGFMGYTLGPLVNSVMSLPGGAQSVAMALGATGSPSWACRPSCWSRSVTSASWAGSCSWAW